MTAPISMVSPGPVLRATSAPARRYELDWLRAFVVLGLIPIHAAVIFSTTADTYIKNGETSWVMAVLGVFAGTWGMPLLFAVAGASAYFALRRRSGSQYLGERALRLLVPFIFATLTIIPVQVYALVVSDPGLMHAYNLPIRDPNFASSWLAFYPEYLHGYGYFLTHFSTTLAIVFWGHLWFIPRLLIYAVATLPLFLWLDRERGQRLLAWLGGLMRYPGMIYIFIVPLVVVEMVARTANVNKLTATWPLYDDWVQFSFYLLYFVYGYLLFAIPTMTVAVKRYGWLSLALGVGGFALALALPGTLTSSPFSYSLGYIVGAPVRGFVSWFWIVAILAFALSKLAFTNGLLRYLNEAAFPIYVLHMPVVTIVGMYAIQFDVPMYIKFVVIIVVALGLTLAVFETLVRRWTLMRLLFGLKPSAESGSIAPAAVPA